MLSQLPAATDRKVKQQFNWKNTYKSKLGLITNKLQNFSQILFLIIAFHEETMLEPT